MLILALDSTAVVASVALCRDETPVAAFTVKNGNTHSETLLPMVESVLKTAGYTVDDIDLFACSVGPGSFTGVRIGVATIKGLAFGKNKPCVAVSTLEALAENLVPQSGILCPVMNARRGQVYNALFRYENGELRRLCDDRAMAATELEAELLAMGEPVIFSGDGVGEIRRLCKEISPSRVSDQLVDQNAVSVAKCAYRAYLRGDTCADATLSPIYLRLPQAERERLAKQNEKKM
ncbi:MAG: tRNA (adenosine(37)-N6)-threonylcarbamoyltransferase complex dimerization subunit type 1 TsaB [Ruminococcaceae bacterium]|nr:tRNA (adenosine(37)-N6)-threonylcarbamoyltransferase complex dimerization subunit type 1 TsaB [Oscillospiraceae bacterium]